MHHHHDLGLRAVQAAHGEAILGLLVRPQGLHGGQGVVKLVVPAPRVVDAELAEQACRAHGLEAVFAGIGVHDGELATGLQGVVLHHLGAQVAADHGCRVCAAQGDGDHRHAAIGGEHQEGFDAVFTGLQRGQGLRVDLIAPQAIAAQGELAKGAGLGARHEAGTATVQGGVAELAAHHGVATVGDLAAAHRAGRRAIAAAVTTVATAIRIGLGVGRPLGTKLTMGAQGHHADDLSRGAREADGA